jgi:ribulose-phosphate 3-epimerase
MSDFKISASILSANFAKLGEEVTQVLEAGADFIHFDVMDHHYVPNLSVGPIVCTSLRQYGIKAPIDVHLMTKPVDSLIVEFAKAGASYITIHPESTEHLDRSLQLIKDNGCRAGIAFNPSTALYYLEYILDKIDLILIMSVNPGFGGQKFIPQVLPKIAKVHQIIRQSALSIRIEVDGGVKTSNIHHIANAGADTFVIGSEIFGSKDYTATITTLRAELNRVNQVTH